MRVAVQTKGPYADIFANPVEMVVADASPVATMLNEPFASDYVILGQNGTETRYERWVD